MLKRKEFILGAAAGLTLAAAATAGGVITWPGAHAEPQAVNRITPVPANGDSFSPPPGAPNSFATIFEQVAPAVVQIDELVVVTDVEKSSPYLVFNHVILRAVSGERVGTRIGPRSGAPPVPSDGGPAARSGPAPSDRRERRGLLSRAAARAGKSRDFTDVADPRGRLG